MKPKRTNLYKKLKRYQIILIRTISLITGLKCNIRLGYVNIKVQNLSPNRLECNTWSEVRTNKIIALCHVQKSYDMVKCRMNFTCRLDIFGDYSA